jgi:hypothetical protein
MNTPRGVAVNQSTGDIYVVDGNNQRIQRFSSACAFISTWGQDVDATTAGTGFEICTAASGDTCKKGLSTATTTNGGDMNAPQGIALDQSTGNVYVTDQGNRRVQEFDASGNFIRAFGWDVTIGGITTYEICSVAAECKQAASGAGAGQFAGTMGYPAIDGSGNLYVADQANRRVDKFDLAGNFVSAYGWGVDTSANAFESCTTASTCNAGFTTAPGDNPGQFGTGGPNRITTDSAGSVYAVDAGNNRVQKFSSSGTPMVSSFAATQLSGSPAPTALATDAATNRILVAKSNGTEVNIFELDTGGVLRDTHMSGAGIANAGGLAENTVSGAIYVSSTTGGQRIYILGTPLVPPTAAIDPVTTFTGSMATFSGKVNPTGFETRYRFEYVDDADFQASGYQNATKVPLPDASVGSGSVEVPVSQGVTNLIGSTLYHVRLVATKTFAAGSASAETTFTTAAAAPTVSGIAVSAVTTTEATLNGMVNPQHQATSYQFKYGSEDCAISTCASTPLVGAGAGSSAVPVALSISNLQPGTVYHFRLLATNPTDTTESLDTTFTTYPSSAPGLPDNRVYEMVSPPEKHGVNIHNNESVQSAIGGDAAVFASLGGFGDPASAPVLSYYRAERDATAWVTRDISPPLAPQSEILKAPLMTLSKDLNRSVVSAFPAPPVVPGAQPTASDFYRHVIPDGAWENLTPNVPEPDVFGIGRSDTHFAGANDSMSVIGIDTPQKLTLDAPVGTVPSAYIWSSDDQALHFVGIFPDNTIATNKSYVGSNCCGENSNAISGDGSQVVFQAVHPGDQTSVYVRKNPSRPQSPLDGEGHCTVPTDACTVEASASKRVPLDPGGSKAAGFQGASVQGDKILFKTGEELLNSDADTSSDLYLYEPASSGLRRISIDENPADGIGANVVEVLGSSDAADYVYFAAKGLLVPGQPELPGMKLYAWHEDGSPNGVVSYIATLDESLDGHTWDASVNFKRPRVQVSPSGRYLLFTSKTKPLGYENEKPGGCGFNTINGISTPDPDPHCSELYRYYAQTQQTDCVSCDPSGEAATGDAAMRGLGASLVNGIGDFGTGFVSHNVLDDGRVFFETEDALSPSDSNDKTDVYEWEDGKVSLISSGVSDTDSHFGNATPSGNDVFFLTRDRLVGIDFDPNVDLYDARVGGGLAGQNPTSPAPCLADGCRGPAASAPASPNAASASFSGPGNAKPHRHKRRCARAKRKAGVHSKTRCGKKGKRNRANHHQRAAR